MAQIQDLPKYQYEPLPEGDHIRVLDLEPSMDRDAVLCGKLRTVQLYHDDYPYEAMSYTWGEPVFSHMLYVTATNVLEHPKVLCITSNLAALLRRMRYPVHTRTFWIDAICINQQNNEEKSNQIPMMMSIYRRAFQVNIRLGHHPEKEAMMRLLNEFSRRRTPTNGPSEIETEAAREAFCGILSLPWFTRRWIIQEAVVNPDVTVFCGAETMSLIRLFNLVHQLGSESFPLFEPVWAMKKLWNNLACEPIPSAEDEARRGSPTHDFPCPMAALMEQFDHFDCADPRDRIYALSGLQRCANIIPDYGMTTEEVFIHFAETMCSHGQAEWILTMASNRHDGNTAPGFPSWVPDWRSRPLRRKLVENTQLPLMKDPIKLERLENGEYAIKLKTPKVVIYDYRTPIQLKADPFPSNPMKEDIQKWIKHVQNLLRFTNYSLNYIMCQPPEDLTAEALHAMLSRFRLLPFLESFCKFLYEPISPQSCGTNSRFLYGSFLGNYWAYLE